jgi:flagellar biosynthetic protein FliQ
MTPGEVLQISQGALWTILKISLPLLLTALIVGLVISFIQALTQIQEMTLSFIPKIIALFLVMVLLFPFLGGVLNTFTMETFDKIVGVN